MRTDQLIHALAADTSLSAPVWRMLLVALLGGAVVAALLFAVTLGPRPDLAAVALDPRFLFKFVVTLLLAATACAAALRLARPGAESAYWLIALAAAPALLVLGVAAELFVIPSSAWGRRLVGDNWMYCLTYVPLLSLSPLAAALVAIRHGAPTRPALAGATAGLLAGGLGAALYAAHCTDDSPLFVATWYTIAIGGVAVVGAVLGRNVLRW
jgi:hypothetical protein